MINITSYLTSTFSNYYQDQLYIQFRDRIAYALLICRYNINILFCLYMTTQPTISFNPPIGKKYGDPSFEVQATSNSPSPIGFYFNNTNVVRGIEYNPSQSLSNPATVIIVGAGYSGISASQAASGIYKAWSAERVIEIAKANPNLSFVNFPSTKTFGDPNFSIMTTSNSEGAISYESSNQRVVTISGSTVTIVRFGTAIITATQNATNNYNARSVSATITVNPSSIVDPTINFSVPLKTLGDSPFTLTPTSNSDGSFSYTSSNIYVATISGSTVTIVGVGTSTITANQSADIGYNAGTADALLIVRMNSIGIRIQNIDIGSLIYPYTSGTTQPIGIRFPGPYTNTNIITKQRISDTTKFWRYITSSSDGRKLAAITEPGYIPSLMQRTPGYIYTSTDYGATWVERTSPGSKSWFEITSSSDGTKLAATMAPDTETAPSYIWTSTDSGVNWTQRTSSGSKFWRSITSSSDGTKLAAFGLNIIINIEDGYRTWDYDISGGYIYTSSNSGVTWTEITSAGKRYWNDIASSSDGTKLVAIGSNRFFGIGYIYTSTDSGTTWVQQTSAGSKNWRCITSSSDGIKLAACVDGYIYTSIDSGATWVERTSAGFRNWEAITSSSDGTKIAAGVYYGGIYSSIDSGATWVEIQLADGLYLSRITSSSDGSKLAATSYYYSIYTLELSKPLVDIGTLIQPYTTGTTQTIGIRKPSYTNTNIITTERTSAGYLNWSCITSSSDGSKLAACAQNANIRTSTDSGATWVVRIVQFSRERQVITSSSDGSKLAFCVYLGYIFTSSDYGATWVQRISAGSREWLSITSSSDGSKLAACAMGGPTGEYIYTSSDSGDIWVQRISAGSRYWYSITSSSDGSKLAAVVFGGYIYTSSDSGATWVVRTSAGSRIWRHITSSSDGSKLAACAEGANIHTSTDYGATWVERTSSGSLNWWSITSSSDGSKLAACVLTGYIYTSIDSGVTWVEITSAGYRRWVSITSSSDGSKLAACVSDDGAYIYTLELSKGPADIGSFFQWIQ